jgi:hypothetical protein
MTSRAHHPHPEPSRKHTDSRAPHPGFARAAGSRDTSGAYRAVYSGQDRLGAYHGTGNVWTAVDRLGRPLGTYATELEAADAISAAGTAP